MNREQAAQQYLQGRTLTPCKTIGSAFAPANIALVKYWGKRNTLLNLPFNSSLSLSMGLYGASTDISFNSHDVVYLNDEKIDPQHTFSLKIIEFMNILMPDRPFFNINTRANIPTAAGLASSASGFAALILALNDLCSWDLPRHNLSCLARLGSGSAARSLWHGFVEWHKGIDPHGQDCFAQPFNICWPELCLGLLIIDIQNKKMSSRQAMQQTVETSPLYKSWPKTAERDLITLKQHITNKDFNAFGQIAEYNAVMMHATMMAARPTIIYTIPETLSMIHDIWRLRQDGIPVYFTQDAGCNLKVLFLEKQRAILEQQFPTMLTIKPFVLG